MDRNTRVMKHVHPGDDLNDDWVSIMDLHESDWHDLRGVKKS